MKSGADTLKKVSFELDGKAANIVFEDANLDKAIPVSIQAAFMNSGQVCLAGITEFWFNVQFLMSSLNDLRKQQWN